MKQPLNKYPKGWNKRKIEALIKHYEEQTEDEEVAEDEAAFNDPEQTVVLVPRALLSEVNKLLSKDNSTKKRAGTGRRPARRHRPHRAHAA